MAQIENGIILTGLKNLDGVSIENGEVKISSSSLSTDTVTLTATGLYQDYKLTLESDVTVSNEIYLVSGGTLSYKATEGYSLAGNSIFHKTAGEFTISGLKELPVYKNGKIEGVEITGNAVKISAALLTVSDIKLETTGDYKLKLEGTPEGYETSDDGKTIGYTKPVNNDEEITTVAAEQVATDNDVTDFLDDIFNG